MASNYVTSGSYQTVRVQSQTSVVDVEAIGIYTKPSGVYCVVTVPTAAFNAGGADSYLDFAATEIEALVSNVGSGTVPLVSGASYVQDIDSSGLLSAFLDFTVAYTPTSGQQGTFTSVVRLPMTLFESAAAYESGVDGQEPVTIIADAHAKLVALAGG